MPSSVSFLRCLEHLANNWFVIECRARYVTTSEMCLVSCPFGMKHQHHHAKVLIGFNSCVHIPQQGKVAGSDLTGNGVLVSATSFEVVSNVHRSAQRSTARFEVKRDATSPAFVANTSAPGPFEAFYVQWISLEQLSPDLQQWI